MNICNGCGGETPEWGTLCKDCNKEVVCQGCDTSYKRGQGLQEVNMCPRCLNESMETSEMEYHRLHGDYIDPYEEYGFDHHWER